MKFLVVYGSPDNKGNSTTLGGSLVKAASEQGAEIEEMNINDYKISYIWKDYFGDALSDNFEKAGDDDMPALKEKINAADIIVLVSPVYWYQLAGAMKAFVDRWTDFLNSDFSSGLKGKGLALVTTHSGLNVMNSSNYVQLAMHATADFLGMTWMGGIDANARMPFNDGPSPAHAQIASDFGKNLALGKNLIGMQVLGN